MLAPMLYRKPCFRMIRIASLLFWVFFLFNPSASFAKTEQDIKAAYLFNFIKFVTWPTRPEQTDFTLCAIGEDPALEKIKLLEDRNIHSMSLHVELISSPNHNINCDVLYVGESEKKFIDKIVNYYAQSPTLTVSSTEDFILKGGMIGFITLGNIIRFDINLKQARETQLSISSKLLELANQVEQ